MTTAPDCLLYVDGVRYLDGQVGEPDVEPVALTDLEIRWGRGNTVDQPSPATATFRVLDVPGGGRFLDRLHMGARVEITAGATIYGDPTLPTITNPGFENLTVGAVPASIRTNGTARAVSAPTHAGTRAVRIDSTDPDGQAVEIIFPPAPFSTDPSAWDAIPRTIHGQVWTYGASVLLSQQLSTTAQAVTVKPVTFLDPRGLSGTYAVQADTLTGNPAVAGWQSLQGEFVPPDGQWLGIAVRMYPTGPVWEEVPASVHWDTLGATPVWSDLGMLHVDDLLMLAPPGGAARSGSVFSGRVTDMTAEYDAGGTIVGVTAQDDLAEFANRYIGATPWGAESLNSRFSRIMTEAGQAINWSVDAGVRSAPISYRDVDNQPAAGLLQELAKSVAGALWEATSITSGPFLRLEDVNARVALLLLGMGADGLVHITVSPDAAGKSIVLSACSVLLDPVRWEQDSTDASSRVALTWLDQVVDPGPPEVIRPTSREILVVDADVEAQTGQRRVGVSTQLSDAAYSDTVANAYLARLAQPGWRVSGLTIDLSAEDLTPDMLGTVMTVLDGVTRVGLGIILTDMPEWSPAGNAADQALYLEGGRFTNTDGAWVLELVTSSAYGQGKAAVNWNQLPVDWSWDEFGPEVDWDDLHGVALGALA